MQEVSQRNPPPVCAIPVHVRNSSGPDFFFCWYFWQDFGPAGVEVNWEALVDTRRHGVFFGGGNTGVRGDVQAHWSCLLPPPMAGKIRLQKTHPSLAHMCSWIYKLVPGSFVVAPAAGKAVPAKEAPHCPCWGLGVLSGQGVRRQT